MKIVSWNVAGFRAVLKKGFIDFYNEINADVICLQEVKATKDQIDFVADGYYEYLNPAERKGYAGTMIYSKIEPISVNYGMHNSYNDEGRLITLEFNDYYLVNTYVPNVKPDLSRLDYRMNWEDEFLKYLKELEKNKPVIVCGDFNVAHNEIDIKNAKSNIGNAGFTYEERGKFTDLLSNGFIDTFRQLYPNRENAFTWWTYIGDARSRNVGWRLDYFVVSKSLEDKIIDSYIYSNYYGSDHCPIGLEVK
jgi:exodeoxyribonuclease-3